MCACHGGGNDSKINLCYEMNMNMTILDLFNKRLDASLQNTIKIPFFYFILIFSVFVIVLFPLYVKGNGAKPLPWILTALVLGIMLFLLYIIYITGGFHG